MEANEPACPGEGSKRRGVRNMDDYANARLHPQQSRQLEGDAQKVHEFQGQDPFACMSSAETLPNRGLSFNLLRRTLRSQSTGQPPTTTHSFLPYDGHVGRLVRPNMGAYAASVPAARVVPRHANWADALVEFSWNGSQGPFRISWIRFALPVSPPLGQLMSMPRPKWLSNPAVISSAILNLGGFKRVALAIHGALILRECWYRVFEAGTFRLFLKSVGLWFCGQGWEFDFPHAKDPSPQSEDAERDASRWYVTTSDLDTFKEHTGASGWELMMEKNIPDLIKYQAWRRTLPSEALTPYSPRATSQRGATESNLVMHPIGEHSDESQDEEEASQITTRGSKSGMKGLATLAVAGGLAMMMRRSSSGTLLRARDVAKKQAQLEKFPKNRYRRTTSEYF
eukprot:gene7966-1182_t